MNTLKSYAVAGVVGTAMAFTGGVAYAECSAETWQDCAGGIYTDGAMETPLGEKWWPNALWGAGDEAGSTNWYKKPEVVKRALSVIKQGKTMEIGHEYHADMPLFGARKFSLRIPGTPTGGAFGPNRIMWNDEFLATEIGQVGTQFDGLGHIGVQVGADGDKNEMRWYNGFTAAEMGSAYGLLKLGTQELHPIIARGILFDIAGLKGRDMNKGEVITVADLMAALKRQGMEGYKFMPGDAVVFRTGWESNWEDPPTYNDGCPGIGMEVARWVAANQAGITAGDTWPVDAVPNPDPTCVFCVHQYLQVRHGIVNQENLRLKELADAGVYEFAYFFAPAPIRGATGAIGNPVAIW
ncbi:MAG: cyclase family protein [Alphaproteobacteria bacterium]|jgi:kynurenine formamidase|nr:cyclase family protein [Alphaproteobacteria bacterium]MDP6516892.1 cyclase family protein [Alphaproteobacteria bacterium]